MKATKRLFNILLGLLVFLALWASLATIAQSSVVVFSEDFEDGDVTSNPEWIYTTNILGVQNPRFEVINGELHSDGEEYQDSSDRWASNFVHTPAQPIQTTEDYLEFSFRGFLKSAGNPQQGRTVQIHLHDYSSGKSYILFVGRYHGYWYSPLELRLYGGLGENTLFSITAGFIPAFDQWYEVKGIRQNGILHLYVNGVLVNSVADPVGLPQISNLDLDLTGSVIVDDVIVKAGTPNSPPVCEGAYPSVDFLWPPQHQMEPVQVLGVTDPDGDPTTITITSIYQDEPTNGLGDGDTSPDGEGLGTDTAFVRAERSGTGNGRMYHISFMADDGHGGTCEGAVYVGVKHDQGKNTEFVDDGPQYDSTTP